MKLENIFEQHDFDTLSLITRHWDIDTSEIINTDIKALLCHIIPRLLSEPYFEIAFSKLSDIDRMTLEFIASHGGIMDQSELLFRCFNGNPNELEDSLDRLLKSGFLFPFQEVPNCYILLEKHLSFLVLPSHMSCFLGRMLANLSIEELKVICQYVGLSGKLSDKLSYIVALRNFLLNPDNLKSVIRSLSSDCSQIFWKLVNLEGHAFHKDILDLSSCKFYDSSHAEQLEFLIKNSGIVFAARKGANRLSDLIIIPRDIFYILYNNFTIDNRTALELSTLAKSVVIGMTPSEIHENSQTLLRDLVVFAANMDLMSPNAYLKLKFSEWDFMEILPILSFGKSQYYAVFLTHYLKKRKFYRIHGKKLTLTTEFCELIKHPKHLFIDLFNWWISSQLWNETFVLQFEKSYSCSLSFEISIVRRHVMTSLRQMSAQTWIPVREFISAILPSIEQELLVRGKKLTRHELTDLLEFILTTSLNWLGFIAIGSNGFKAIDNSPLSAYHSPNTETIQGFSNSEYKVFRITPVGKCLLKELTSNAGKLNLTALDSHAFFLHDARWFFVQGNYEIIAPPDLSLDLLESLCSFTSIKSNDVMSIFLLSSESIARGIRNGYNIKSVIRCLENHSRNNLPDTVRLLIQQIDESFENAKTQLFSTQVMLMSDNPVTFNEISNSQKFHDKILQTSDSKIIVFKPQYSLSDIENDLSLMGIHAAIQNCIQDERGSNYLISVSENDIVNLHVAIRILQNFSEQYRIDFKNADLIETIECINSFLSHHDNSFQKHCDGLASSLWQNIKIAIDDAVTNKTTELKEKLKWLAEKSKGQKQSLSKVHYPGRNPAIKPSEIRALLQFSVNNGKEVQIEYVKKNRTEMLLNILPKTLEGNRLLAFCIDTEMDTVYSVDRIIHAKFPGEIDV